MPDLLAVKRAVGEACFAEISTIFPVPWEICRHADPETEEWASGKAALRCGNAKAEYRRRVNDAATFPGRYQPGCGLDCDSPETMYIRLHDTIPASIVRVQREFCVCGTRIIRDNINDPKFRCRKLKGLAHALRISNIRCFRSGVPTFGPY